MYLRVRGPFWRLSKSNWAQEGMPPKLTRTLYEKYGQLAEPFRTRFFSVWIFWEPSTPKRRRYQLSKGDVVIKMRLPALLALAVVAPRRANSQGDAGISIGESAPAKHFPSSAAPTRRCAVAPQARAASCSR